MRYLIITAFFLIGQATYSQEWRKMILHGEKDFYKIQKAYYDEWGEKPIKKGIGYKQFKRWEHKNLPRLTDGRYLSNSARAYQFRHNADRVIAPGMNRANNGWTPLGPYNWENGPNGYNPGLGRVNSIDIDPNDPNTLFVGTPSGGLWKSTDLGSTWSVSSEDLTVLGVTDIYINPDNSDQMYMLSGDAYGSNTNFVGVFKTEDGGVTWTNSMPDLEASDYYIFYKMIVDPDDYNTVLITGNDGTLKTINGGSTWQYVSDRSGVDMVYKPGDFNTIYVSEWGSGIIQKSVDAGESWKLITVDVPGGRTALGVSEDEPDYLYILCSAEDATFGGVYRSTDEGENFDLMSNSPNIFGYSLTADDDSGQGWYDLAIAVNPDDANDIYVSGVHIWNSKDGGASWQDENDNYGILNYWVYDPNKTGFYVHADNHTLDFLNGDLYAGCDGGIFRSETLGQNWTDISAGINNTQFYRLGQDHTDETIIVAGAQDNGSNILKNDQWYHIFGADGMEAIVDYEDTDIVYTSYQNGGIIKHGDRGNEYLGVFDPSYVGESGNWITPYLLDPTDHTRIFVGYQNVWSTTDHGQNFTQHSNFGSTFPLNNLTISDIDPDYLYVSNSQETYASYDGAKTWTPISSGLSTQFLTYLAISEDDPLTVWATFAGYSPTEKVYESTDGGQTWTNISDGLPNLPVNCIVHQKGSNKLYAGTDVGVYLKDGSGGWVVWSEGLPNVIIYELEIHYQSDKIRAATYGRGIWEAPLTVEATVIDLIALQASETEVLEQSEVTFSSQYTGTAIEWSWSFPGGDPSTSSEQNPQVTYAAKGTYDVSLTLTGINQEEITETNFIQVYEPVVITDVAASEVDAGIGSTVEYSYAATGDIVDILWTFEGGQPATSTEDLPAVTYNEEGAFDVTLLVNGYLGSQDEQINREFIIVAEPLSVEETTLFSYPTQVEGALTLNVMKPNTSVRILDATGKAIATENFSAAGSVKLDFRNFPVGVYYIEAIAAGHKQSGRVIKK